MLLQKTITGKMEVRGVHSPLTSYYITIRGGFPLSSNDNKLFKIKQVFEKAAVENKDKQLIVDCKEEPMLFGFRDKSKSWFNILHDLSKHFQIPEENIVFLTSNIYSTESYNKWCIENQIDKKIKVYNQPKSLWLERLILNGCGYLEKKETKHVSMFVGRPTLHRNFVLQWYLKNIVNTPKIEKMITSFFYENFDVPDDWDLTNEQKKYFNSLTKNVENIARTSNKWLDETDEFKSSFSSCLFNFNIDYHEAENFYSFEDYKEFKNKNDWWKEDSLSEKLFRSIIYKRPFIRLGMPNSLKVLRSWGFKTFDGILFDESYDDIEDCFERTDHILKQVTSYLDMPFDELKEKIYSDEVQEVLEHNYKLAYQIYNNKENLINV